MMITIQDHITQYLLFHEFLSAQLQGALLFIGVVDDVLASTQQFALHGLDATHQLLLHLSGSVQLCLLVLQLRQEAVLLLCV